MGVFLKIWIWFLSGLYKICSWIYKIFIALAGKQLVSTATFQTIVDNTYIIIGVIMLFVLSFSLLKGMVNPDDSKAGTSTIKKIVINLVTSVVILAVTPMVFNFAYDVQDSIINYNTIGGFFGFGSLGDSGADSNDNPATVAANQIVNSVWTAFFNVDEEWCFEQGYPEIQSCQEQIKAEKSYIDGVPVNGGTFKDVINSVDETGHFNMYNQFADEADDGSIAFYGFLALIGGIALLYVSVSYTFGLAIRLVKLFFYEVIAPVPILLRVVPNGKASGMFNQWLKITLTCYAEVFVRLFILYFCLFICMEIRGASFFDSIVPSTTETILYSDSNTNYFENDNYTLAYAGDDDYFENKETMLAEGEDDTETTATTQTTSSSGGGWFLNLITKAFLYMGIFMFMKSAPKIISEVTGIDSGKMKLGIKDTLAEAGVLTAGATLGAGITAGIRGATSAWEKDENGNLIKKPGSHATRSAIAGALSGAVRGGKAGWGAKNLKDMKAAATSGAKGAVEAREKRANYKAAHGGKLQGVISGHTTDFKKMATNYVMDQSIEGLTRESQNMGRIISSYNTFNDTIEQLLEKEQSKGDGSAFLTEGFKFKDNEYKKFDAAAKKLAEAKAQFAKGELSADELREYEGKYTSARDAARDAIMNMSLQGNEGEAYKALTTKGQALLKDSLVNAETLQATILSNADSKAVQDVMGANGALEKLVRHEPLEVTDFKNSAGDKLRDVAKVYQGEADIKAAVMQKENAAKGDKK